MHAFTVHPQKTPPPADGPPRRRWRRWVAVVGLVLGLGGLVWAVRPDPHLSRARALQAELFSPQAKTLSPDERKAKFTELRQQVKQLSDDQRWELGAPMREKQKAELDRYFALPPREKVKYLDERIDRSEKMRKEFEKKAAANGKAGQGKAGGFPRGGPLAASRPASGGGPLAASKTGPRPQRSADEIEQRKKVMLDRTTPDERAKRDVYRKEMNDRRKQRGLPIR
jgi:hypothetical protein